MNTIILIYIYHHTYNKFDQIKFTLKCFDKYCSKKILLYSHNNMNEYLINNFVYFDELYEIENNTDYLDFGKLKYYFNNIATNNQLITYDYLILNDSVFINMSMYNFFSKYKTCNDKIYGMLISNEHRKHIQT